MRTLLPLAVIGLCLVSCSALETERGEAAPSPRKVFYARLDIGTKVSVDESVKLFWNEDDRITIFDKVSYNQEYRFTGETGDRDGEFVIVPNDDFHTGNKISSVYAVYPYLESTKISNKEVLTVTLPSEQHYRENAFGLGANLMVSVTADDDLLFKNVGGYLVLKFYGEGVSVSSVKLTGNRAEQISGKATLSFSEDGIPSATPASTALSEVTLTCEMPVVLGATKEEAVAFWMVLYPADFAEGFMLTVTDSDGRTFTKTTDKSLSVVRNGVRRIAPVEVVM